MRSQPAKVYAAPQAENAYQGTRQHIDKTYASSRVSARTVRAFKNRNTRGGFG